MANAKNIFLTGASSGIGLAAARAFLGAGHAVWGTSRDPARLPNLPGLHPVRLDLNDLPGLRASFKQAAEEAAGFDVLVNNAGDVVNGPLEVLAADGLRKQMETLFFAPVELIRLALPEMRRRKRGLIVNVTSLAVQFPIPFNGGYNAAKAALAAATEGLRLELLGSGIRAVDVQPGDVTTGILRRSRISDAPECAPYQPNLDRARKAEVMKERGGIRPERVARLFVRLLDDPNPPPRIFIGNSFEAQVAPLGARLVPRRVIEWGQRKTYNLKA
jgi:NAD(P)-dependent dehydrogenase (short-subunit alcohol dehydrogenase family)